MSGHPPAVRKPGVRKPGVREPSGRKLSGRKPSVRKLSGRKPAAGSAVLEAGRFAALSSPRRLQVLEWLRNPRAHFPPQRDGDLVRDGVCVIFLAGKLRVRQPTATAHLQILARAGLVTSRRVGQWTFYKRDEPAIRALKRAISKDL